MSGRPLTVLSLRCHTWLGLRHTLPSATKLHNFCMDKTHFIYKIIMHTHTHAAAPISVSCQALHQSRSPMTWQIEICLSAEVRCLCMTIFSALNDALLQCKLEMMMLTNLHCMFTACANLIRAVHTPGQHPTRMDDCSLGWTPGQHWAGGSRRGPTP